MLRRRHARDHAQFVELRRDDALPLKTAELVITRAMPLTKLGRLSAKTFARGMYALDETPYAMLKPCEELNEIDLSFRNLEVTISASCSRCS